MDETQDGCGSGRRAAYFDHNATTPLDPRVVEAMLPWLSGSHGNPSSAHGFGRAARRAVEKARRQVAALLGVDLDAEGSGRLVFTASGSEANNMVIAAVGRRWSHRGHVVLASFEHPSVVRAVERLTAQGMTATRVAPGADGVVPAEELMGALTAQTRLVCLMLANNELGTIQPVQEVAAACRERGIPLLCDAVQAAGKIEVDGPALGVDALTLGGHKFHGPLGAAALWLREEGLREGLEVEPYVLGAAQEGGLRAGTENVPALVGLGTASELARRELAERRTKLAALRDRLEEGLGRIPDARIHGAGSPRLPHTTNVAFPGLVAAELMAALDGEGFAVSTGAACSSGRPTPSATLLSMGLPREQAVAALRISFGLTNTQDEIERFLAVLPSRVEQLRNSQRAAVT